MKKLTLIGLLLLSLLTVVPAINAQGREYPQEQNRSWRHNRRWKDYDARVYVLNEYRYVRYGRRVYKETYRSTYNRNGRLISRILVNRERMYQYENYRHRDFRNNGIKFNVFLRF